DKKEIELSEIRSLEELAPGAYGILEPKKEFLRPAGYEEIQLVIVPGIAFDLKGNRIGYGLGYYDKLLPKLKCPKLALAFNFQVLPEIVEEKHDVKVDKIITETDVINIK
ncbi:5-formyltetrahydrofolate cyclo-ligase, partial [Candidatus Micrarchaeota archaeon]|nr:5-formyltetrahydrofolate cyclo-ligase [Candidatus Micrarchaeota archaeon]